MLSASYNHLIPLLFLSVYMMMTIEFSEADIEALDHERFNHPHPKVRRKMEALYLKANGLKHHEICRLCAISKHPLVTWLKQYTLGGIER